MADYLSVDDAVAQLTAVESAPAEAPAAAPAATVEPAAEASAEAAQSPAAQADPIEGATTPESADAPAEPASEGDPAEPIEPVKPAVEAPHFWSADAKARFADLPPEIQSVILDQGKNGERAVNQAQEKLATERKAAEEARTKAEAEHSRITDLAARLGEIVPDKEAQFKERWKDATPDAWIKLAQENPDQYAVTKAMFDAETAEVQRLKDAKTETDRLAEARDADDRRAWAQKQAADLREYAPELADPVKGKANADRLVAYLRTSLKVSDADLPGIPAVALAAGYKAMLWDEAQAKARTPAPPAPKPAKAPAVPARGAPAATPKTAAATAVNQLAKTGRPEDAVAALLAMQG